MADPFGVLIVDDSRSIRHLLRQIIQKDPRLAVAGEAENADQARALVLSARPAVLTLDAEMPGKNGMEFLADLMRYRPTPVVMFSSRVKPGSKLGLQALALGAVACLEKPVTSDLAATMRHLVETLVMAAQANVSRGPRPFRPLPDAGGNYDKVLMVGASTGGVEAIDTLLAGFDGNCPATLITQHMPDAFLRNFALRLDQHHAPSVRLAEPGAVLAPGLVMIAPGGAVHLELAPELHGGRVRLASGPKMSGHCPSVDRLFLSGVAQAQRIVALLLTGMGRDGAIGMKALRDAGAVTLAQSRESCVVFGMPRAAGELDGVSEWVALRQAADRALAHCRSGLVGTQMPGTPHDTPATAPEPFR